MKKVTILALHLGYGGIEKSIVALANLLADDYEVEIISSYQLFEKPAFDIDPRVEVRYLITRYKPNREAWKSSIKHLRPISFVKESFNSVMTLALRRSTMIRAIENCHSDIIISTRDLFNTWLGTYGRKSCYKIGWEHNHYHGDMSYADKVTKSAKNLDALVLVSDSLRKFYKKQLADTKCKCFYIPNMLDSVPDQLSKLNEKRLISVGRLSREKGYEDLLDVFKLIHQEEPSWRLDIIGDGAQKNLLGDRIFNEGLKECVTLHGFQDKTFINNLLSKSSIYLMTSVTESFGIVLIEAMSYGLPCVAFDSAEGATELIQDGVNGYLISYRNKEEYAKKVVELIRNKKLRTKLGSAGRKTSLNYTGDKVKRDWIKLLKRK
ncbi:MAG TPA: glycosyltransferase [Candidatus Faecenecus gallistercoris]|uniref:Glycosyltransferase n=1 Tax=Candidatus Faecenecus gallistercoris TaxID=2840793 RepID=A0A9D0Z0Q6_9FIRM|nr:glycosyltransferase [Candidatus Faecenecus gallistercoris]